MVAGLLRKALSGLFDNWDDAIACKVFRRLQEGVGIDGMTGAVGKML